MAGVPEFLKIKTTQQRQVALMLAIGFFMGVFIATYQVTADSIFLNKLGQYLDKAFLVAGILGIVSTGLFSYFQSVIRFSTLTQISVAIILMFTVAVHFLLHFGDPAWHNVVIFTMYCGTGPMIAVLLLSYWGTFGRLFNFRQTKSIIGWIDTGQLVAAILASFVIPLTATLVPDTTDYLLLCAVSMFIVGGLLFIIAKSFSLSKNDPSEFDENVKKETSINRMFSDKYIIIMSLMLLVSMTAFVLNQYQFQQMVQIQYPDQRELTNFNAFFMGAVYVLSLVMQTFINNRIIGTYGLRISLLILPFVLAVFSVGGIITGFAFGFDKAASPAGFIYFFLFVAMSRLFNWTLRDSLENPVFKLFFIPLDGRLRFNIQARVEGVVNESARFVGGLIIFALAFIPFFKIIHISIFLVGLVIAYYFVVNRLYGGYRNKIRLKLENADYQQDKLEKGFTQVTRKLETMLMEPDPRKAVFSFKLLEKINASQISVWVNNLIRNQDDSVNSYAQERLNEIKGLSVSDKYVIRMDSDRVETGSKNILSKMDLELIIQNGGDITKTRIQRLTRSTDPDDRQYAAELLLHTSAEECVSFLIELLNDSEPKVRNTAIRSSVKKWNTEVIYSLIENLGNPVYSNQAMNTLILIGNKTLPMLDSAFYRSNQSTQVMLRLVQVMGRIGGQRAKDILWNKIDYPSKVIVSQVLLSLGECGFKAGVSQITRIKYAIETDIADIRWNLSAIQEVGEDGFNSQIVNSLRGEIKNDIEHIYMLLAMLYDTRSIQLVKENIDSGTSEGITYAVELLDVFLSDQLKQRVIPILDDIPDSDRINKLDIFFPRVKLDSRLALKFMINRDFTQSNRWTKACILYQIGLSKQSEFKLDLIAQMFNPDNLVREVAGWALYQISEKEYLKNVTRLPEDQRKRLNEIVIEKRRLSNLEEVLFFQQIDLLEGIPGITLSYLADISEEIQLREGESMILDENVNNDFYVMINGSVDFYQKGVYVSEFHRGQFIGEMLSKANYLNTNLIIAKTNANIIKFNKDKFYELLADNVKLADKVLQYA
ncbi:MAG TPA: HEAT repeat domain-containing protein [Cyclobacteriaceae bacterium]|nr:HEAT repeat domain-containing protein [Cyclobacteriaceae bacterium]HMX01816.1 HEAT repeat domain-containing protein [Cyclobacteriaceae bacterium]HMX51563.1 HEAT repeat domain-containing protein [Cyclobacteriaceae bacterium]HMY95640.1 HEAT repeat domain-containing protein [Cyclobacteriaceae bacterium]HNA14390.1 HEAT repeat domain-containing protein [Cyclobacteriaceae bacterium]